MIPIENSQVSDAVIVGAVSGGVICTLCLVLALIPLFLRLRSKRAEAAEKAMRAPLYVRKALDEEHDVKRTPGHRPSWYGANGLLVEPDALDFGVKGSGVFPIMEEVYQTVTLSNTVGVPISYCFVAPAANNGFFKLTAVPGCGVLPANQSVSVTLGFELQMTTKRVANIVLQADVSGECSKFWLGYGK